MSVIRVVWGTATGPTELAAYDAALADAGVGDYNLVTLSSVLPAEPHLEVVGTAPDLGPVGEELRVVQSRADAAAGETAAAGVGWARSESGRGIFYEVAGSDAASVESEIEAGLDAGKSLRDWTFTEEETVVREVAADDGESDEGAAGGADGGVDGGADGGADGGEYACSVVLATYGESRPVL